MSDHMQQVSVWKSASAVLRQVTVAVVGTVLLTALSGCGDVRNAQYETLARATAAGIVADGNLLPAFLPPSTVNIRLRYNIDTNEIWAAFEWNGVHRDSMDAECKRAELTPEQFPFRAPSWWHPKLQNGSTVEANVLLELLKCTQGFVALSKEGTSRGYYWQLSS